MRKTLGGVLIALVAAAGGAWLTAWAVPLSGQTPAAYRAPRTADGKPDLNGIWQSLSGANYMPQPFQILQSQSAVFFAYQYAGAVRNIYLKDPGPAPVDSWMGQSVGRWEGDTLVVDVTGFNEETWFDRSGNFHSDALHVVERYTRSSHFSWFSFFFVSASGL